MPYGHVQPTPDEADESDDDETVSTSEPEQEACGKRVKPPPIGAKPVEKENPANDPVGKQPVMKKKTAV